MSPNSTPNEVLWSSQKLVDDINQKSFLKLKELNVDDVLKLGRDPSAVKPIGPRQGCEGIRDNRQGILTAQTTKEGAVVLRMTLLAAGFVAGPQGCSVREISAQTGAKVNSWYSEQDGASETEGSNLDVRIFLIDGPPYAVLQALQIVIAAVNRYKTLVEGHCKERKVCTEQIVSGIKFFYKPPPLRAMPNAVRTFQTTQKSFQGPQKQHLVLKDPTQHLHTLPLHSSASIYLAQQAGVPQPAYHHYAYIPSSPTYPPFIDTGAQAQPPLFTQQAPPQLFWRPKTTAPQQSLYYPTSPTYAMPSSPYQYQQPPPMYVNHPTPTPPAPLPVSPITYSPTYSPSYSPTYDQINRQSPQMGDYYKMGVEDRSSGVGSYYGMVDASQQWSVQNLQHANMVSPTY